MLPPISTRVVAVLLAAICVVMVIASVVIEYPVSAAVVAVIGGLVWWRWWRNGGVDPVPAARLVAPPVEEAPAEPDAPAAESDREAGPPR